MRSRGPDKEAKFGWYYRNWSESGLDPAETMTLSLQDWDEQIAEDPLFCGEDEDLEVASAPANVPVDVPDKIPGEENETK